MWCSNIRDFCLFLRITFVSSIRCSGMHRRLVHQERQGYIPPIIVVRSMLPLPWSGLFMMFTCLTRVKTWWWGECFLAICSEYLLRPTVDTVDVKSNHPVYVGCLHFTRSSWILSFNLANVELHLFKWGESFQSLLSISLSPWWLWKRFWPPVTWNDVREVIIFSLCKAMDRG